MRLRGTTLLAITCLLIAACSPVDSESDEERGGPDQTIPDISPASLDQGERLRVVATTNIVGDVVGRVGDDAIDLIVLIELGQDPHSYEPTAREIASLEDAHLIFVNGLDLEEQLGGALEVLAEQVPVVPVSAGVELLISGAEADPHTWMDPANVAIWTRNVAVALSAADPANDTTYTVNSVGYIGELEALDAYIIRQAAAIPDRKLVTDHDSLGYFARAYDFEVIGTVIPVATTQAEPSASDLAALIAAVEEASVPAIFVGSTVSDETARVVAEEVGFEVSVYNLYTGSLGEPGSGADTYIGMMQANIDIIVVGLTGSSD